MATMLSGPLIRETGLEKEGKPIFVILMPSEDGGTLTFKEKGSRGQGFEISLKEVMEMATGGDTGKPGKAIVLGDPKNVDLIDMSILEPKIMVQGEEVFTMREKTHFFEFIREVREECREDMGLPPIIKYRNTDEWKAK